MVNIITSISVPVSFFLARGHAIFQQGRTKYSERSVI